MQYPVQISQDISTQNQELDQIDLLVVDDIISKQSQNTISENTKRNYRTTTRQYNEFVRENNLAIDENSLLLFFDELKDKLKPTTFNTKRYELMKVIKAQFAGDSVLKNLAIAKVFQKVDKYKIDKTIPEDECLSKEDVMRLIDNASTEKTALLIEFVWITACRASEMVNIKLSDVKINNHVKIELIGKGNKQRTVFITQDLLNRIIEVYQGEKYLFESSSGKKLRRTNVTIQIKKVGRKLGFDISAHSLRHARATHLIKIRDFSLKAVSSYLGHSSTSVTADMYLHDSVNPDELLSE